MYYYLIVLCFVHYHIDTTLHAVEHSAIYVTTSFIFHLHIASLHRYLKISEDIHSYTIIVYSAFSACAFSALTLLVGQQEGHPVSKKTRVVGCWRGYLSGARCRLAYGPAEATATHCLLLQ